MLYNFLVATHDLAAADSQNTSIVKAITKMLALKKIGFLAVAFLTSHLVTANNEITFCNIPYVPKAGSPDDIAHCLGQYGFVLNKCYVIPAGYGLKGQSFSVTDGSSVCALFWDSSCRTPNPDGAWYGAEAELMGQDFFSFRCKEREA